MQSELALGTGVKERLEEELEGEQKGEREELEKYKHDLLRRILSAQHRSNADGRRRVASMLSRADRAVIGADGQEVPLSLLELLGDGPLHSVLPLRPDDWSTSHQDAPQITPLLGQSLELLELSQERDMLSTRHQAAGEVIRNLLKKASGGV